MIGGDIADRKAHCEAVKDMDIVYHLAAKLHITNPGPDTYDEFRKINVEGTRFLVDTCLPLMDAPENPLQQLAGVVLARPVI